MNWRRFGKTLFFVGVGIFVWNQAHNLVFSDFYNVWRSQSEMSAVAWQVFDWFHDFRYSLNLVSWVRLTVAGLALWVGAKQPDE